MKARKPATLYERQFLSAFMTIKRWHERKGTLPVIAQIQAAAASVNAPTKVCVQVLMYFTATLAHDFLKQALCRNGRLPDRSHYLKSMPQAEQSTYLNNEIPLTRMVNDVYAESYNFLHSTINVIPPDRQKLERLLASPHRMEVARGRFLFELLAWSDTVEEHYLRAYLFESTICKEQIDQTWQQASLELQKVQRFLDDRS